MFYPFKHRLRNLISRIQTYAKIDMFYLARGGFWTSSGYAITSIFALILTIAFANFLPKDTYGVYRYVMSLAGALGFLTFSGMDTAVTQGVARGHEGIIHYALKVQLKWNLLFLAASTLLSGYYFIHNNHTVALSLLILGAAFPFISAFNVYGAFLAGKKDFKKSSLFGTIAGIVYSLSMILAVFLSRNVTILILVYSLANLLPAIYLYFLTIKIYKPSGQNIEEEKKLFSYGGHLSAVNIFSNLSQYVDKIVVFHFLGAVQLAVYGLAMAIPERVRGFTKNITAIMLPKLSEKNIDEIKSVFYKRTLQSAVIGAIISFTYIVAAPFVFKIFLPKYIDSIRYSQVISFSLIITLPASYMGSVFRSQKMVKLIYLSSTVAHISRIVLFIVFGAVWGIWGVIYASLLTYVLGFFYNIILWEFEIKKHKKLMAS